MGGGAKFSWPQGHKIPKYRPAYQMHFTWYVRWFWVRLILMMSETTAVNRTQMLVDIISNTNRTSITLSVSPQLPNRQHNLQML
jgi:hypothetical protein